MAHNEPTATNHHARAQNTSSTAAVKQEPMAFELEPPPISKPRQVSSSNSNTSATNSTSVMGNKRIFTRDIATMMYGFGDAANPNAETVDCVEDLVIQYIIHITEEAMQVNKSSRITTDDILYIARNDVKKYSRVKELLHMHVQIKNARKAFEDNDKFD